MKSIGTIHFFLIGLLIFPISAQALKRIECDALEKTTSRFADNMINRDIAVNKWAQCWEHSLNVSTHWPTSIKTKLFGVGLVK